MIFYESCISVIKLGFLIKLDVDQYFKFIEHAILRQEVGDEGKSQLGRIVLNLLYGIGFHSVISTESTKEILTAILLTGPKTYSELEAILPSEIFENDTLDDLLKDEIDIRPSHDFNDSIFCNRSSIDQKFCPFYWLYTPELRESGLEFNAKQVTPLQLIDNIQSSSSVSLMELSLMSHVLETEFLHKLSSRLISSDSTSVQDLGLALVCLSFGKISCSTIHKMELLGSTVDQLTLRLSLDTHTQLTPNALAANAKRRAIEKLKSRQLVFDDVAPVQDMNPISAEDNTSKYPLHGSCVVCQELCQDLAFGALARMSASVTIGKCLSTSCLSTCRHLIHLNCFKCLYGSKSSGVCPLCNAAFNMYLPVLPDDYSIRQQDSLYPAFDIIGSGELDLLNRNHSSLNESERLHVGFGYTSFMKAAGAHAPSSPSSWLKFFEDAVSQLKLITGHGYSLGDHLFASRLLVKLISCWTDLGIDENIKMAKERAFVSLLSVLDVHKFDSSLTLNISILSLFLPFVLSHCEQSKLEGLMNGYMLCCRIADKCFTPSLALEQKQLLKYALKLRCDTANLEMLIESSSSKSSLVQQYHGCVRQSSCSEVAFFELPDRYDRLLVKHEGFCCAKCTSRPTEPALCLLCGRILCARAYCCFREDQGECSSHVAEYGYSY